MNMIIFVVSVAAAIALGTVGSYILMMKLLTSKKGKKAVIDYSKELSDVTYELVKANMADTKKWTELMTGAAFEEE